MAYYLNGLSATLERTSSVATVGVSQSPNANDVLSTLWPQTGSGMGYERCGKWAGHKGECEG